MEQPEALLHCFLDLGEAMLAAGADVNRVEDTLTRLGRAYGAVRMDVFVITSSIVVTMSLPDGRDVTQTRRILTPGGTDLTILEDLNALSRRYCTCPLTVKRLRAEITALTQCTAKPLWVFAGSALGPEAAPCSSAAVSGTASPPQLSALPSAGSSGIFPVPVPTGWCSTC